MNLVLASATVAAVAIGLGLEFAGSSRREGSLVGEAMTWALSWLLPRCPRSCEARLIGIVGALVLRAAASVHS